MNSENRGSAESRAALLLLSVSFLLGLLAAPPLLAQQPSAEGAGAEGELVAADFFDVVDVQIVNVDVVVTDRKGNPIPGLTVDDFELFDNGDRVEVTNFYSSQEAGPAPETVGGLESSTPRSAVEASVPPDQRLQLVIFIDNENITPLNRNRVLEALQQSVFTSLKPSDQVTIVSYDGRVNVRQGLTSDPKVLSAAFEEMTQGSTRGQQVDMERISILRELQRTNTEDTFAGDGRGFNENTSDWNGILQTIRSFAQQQHNDLVRTVDVLGAFVDTLSGLQGRKALLYVSDGLSLRPGEALFQAFDIRVRDGGGLADIGPFNVETESRQFDATPLFEKLGKRANASRVTFYTVMATGGRSRGLSLAERGAFVDIGADAASLGQVWSEALDEIETSNYRASMEILAVATGGRSALTTRDFAGALARVQEDLRTYYSLGYEAESLGGKDHRIEVKVKNRAWKVRHRETYRQRTVEEQMEVRTRSALFFGEAQNPLGVRVEFGPVRAAEKNQYLVPVIVKFPLARVVLTPGESAHEGRVTLYVGARDRDGGLSPVQTMPAPIHIPNDKVLTALGQVAGYRMMLLIGPGDHQVAVTVRDELAQTDSSALVTYSPDTAVDTAADATLGAVPADSSDAARNVR